MVRGNSPLTWGFIDVPKSYRGSMFYLSHRISLPLSLSHFVPSPLALFLNLSASGIQPGSDLERHAAFDCAHLQTESASRRGPSMAEEWGWPGV